MKEQNNELLVLKVGTSTLVENDTLDERSFLRIGEQIARLRDGGSGVALVTSSTRNRLSHVGWRDVVKMWDTSIGGNIQDFLVTDRELDIDGGCKNVFAALKAGQVAVVNANDAQLAKDSHYRSNDIVGAKLATLATASGSGVAYGMLSDIHGVLSDVTDGDSVISRIDDLSAHWHLAGGTGSHGATGGMATKFTAAAMTTANGIATWIAHGRTDNAIELAMSGRIGTTIEHTSSQAQAAIT